jgi:hypothetical protein
MQCGAASESAALALYPLISFYPFCFTHLMMYDKAGASSSSCAWFVWYLGFELGIKEYLLQ